MMPMFNQGGRSAMLLSFANQSFLSQNDGFTFNNSAYVHALNRTLQLETAIVGVYSAKLRSNKSLFQEISIRTNEHLNAQRQLVRIICEQRGLPDSDPSSLVAVASTFAAKASKWIPTSVNSPVLDVSARGLEGVLTDKYEDLLKIAPPGDHVILSKLLEQVRDFSLEPL